MEAGITSGETAQHAGALKVKLPQATRNSGSLNTTPLRRAGTWFLRTLRSALQNLRLMTAVANPKLEDPCELHVALQTYGPGRFKVLCQKWQLFAGENQIGKKIKRQITSCNDAMALSPNENDVEHAKSHLIWLSL